MLNPVSRSLTLFQPFHAIGIPPLPLPRARTDLRKQHARASRLRSRAFALCRVLLGRSAGARRTTSPAVTVTDAFAPAVTGTVATSRRDRHGRHLDGRDRHAHLVPRRDRLVDAPPAAATCCTTRPAASQHGGRARAASARHCHLPPSWPTLSESSHCCSPFRANLRSPRVVVCPVPMSLSRPSCLPVRTVPGRRGLVTCGAHARRE